MIDKKSIKRFFNKNQLLLKLFKSIRFSFKKIFIGYRKYPGIPGQIHFNDQSLIKNNSDHYLSVGRSAAKLIAAAMTEAGMVIKENSNILDFPCGYGRVLRFIKKTFPKADFYAGDIDKHALEFCKKEFNVIPVQSDTDFKKVKFPVSYDIIWVGSLFTHVNSKDFKNLLATLVSSLKEKGIIIFTTHGKECLNQLNSYGLDDLNPDDVKNQIESSGFYFKPYPGQSSYGISISSRPFVTEAANQLFGDKAKLIFHRNRGWDNHQDVYAFQKTSHLKK